MRTELTETIRTAPAVAAMNRERIEQATEYQSDAQQQLASELSLKRTRPPAEIRGYEFESFLGSGAYGEVWVALDRNTGRKVAVKFYTHKGGLDWQLLSREVEKLVLLSADRYIVQVLDVGWDATPPHYVMEYIENGSLDEYIKERGTLPVDEAVEMFRHVATGLLHAHNKGVLHCDVKPANVLLDQDHRPRLADFGQSRLSDEQSPALGTLFYMAPEQADLSAMPDARWDVYALGVLLYLMLTGELPHRNVVSIGKINAASGLEERLKAYRNSIRKSPPPAKHRDTPGVDRALAEIVDRCIAANPKDRYPNIQSVIDALDVRERNRARRPLLVMGILGPAILLAVMALFGWRGYTRAMSDSDRAVMHKAQDSNVFAAQFVSSGVAHELERYHRAVELTAESPKFVALFKETINDPELSSMLAQLKELSGDSNVTPQQLGITPERYAELEELREAFEAHPARNDPQGATLRLQQFMDGLRSDERKPKVDSWIAINTDGIHVASSFASPPSRSPIGRNYAYRSYFQNSHQDKPPGFVPRKDDRLKSTHLSGVFRSTATGNWKVAISTPIYDHSQTDADGNPHYLGVLGLTMEMGDFLQEFEDTDSRFAALVDAREGPFQGVILQHPLYEQYQRNNLRLPDSFSRDEKFRVPMEEDSASDVKLQYLDPLRHDDRFGDDYAQPWIMAKAPVSLKRDPKDRSGEPIGWYVLVQEDFNEAMDPVHDLGHRLFREGLTALAAVFVTIAALWYFVVRGAGSLAMPALRRNGGSASEITPRPDKTTVNS